MPSCRPTLKPRRFRAVASPRLGAATQQIAPAVLSQGAWDNGGNCQDNVQTAGKSIAISVRLAQENQALQVQLEALRAAPAPLAAAQAAHDEAAADRVNWQHHIQKYQVGWHDHL